MAKIMAKNHIIVQSKENFAFTACSKVCITPPLYARVFSPIHCS